MKKLILIAVLIGTPAFAKPPETVGGWHCTFADGSTASAEPVNNAYFRCGVGADAQCIGYRAQFSTSGDNAVATAGGGAITISISPTLQAEERVGSEIRKARCEEGPPTVFDTTSLR